MSNIPHNGVRRELEKISKDVQKVVERLEKAIANQGSLDKLLAKKVVKKAASKKRTKKADK